MTKSKAEAEELPIRNTSRKRKLVEYAEAESDGEVPNGGSSEKEDQAEPATDPPTPKGRKKSQKQSVRKARTPVKAETPRRGRAKAKTGTSKVGEIDTVVLKAEEANGAAEEEHSPIVETTTTPSKSKSASKSKAKAKAKDTQGLDPELSEQSSRT